MRTRRSLLLVAMVAALAGPVAAGAVFATAAGAASPVWTIETTPSIGSGSQLNAVRCAAATSCIGVGYYTSLGTDNALAESWNGTAWSQQSVQLPSGARLSQLTGLSCLSTSWCTAVGFYAVGVVYYTLAEFWNGKSWTIETTQNVTGAKLDELTAVSCASAATCSAVGYYENTSGTAMTLAEKWNGHAWSGIAPPNPAGAKGSQLHSVACPSTTSCFAVGNYTNSANVEVVLAETWNGTTWALQAANPPSGSQASALNGVSCTSTSDCTAVGDAVSFTEATLAEGWNGHQWSVQGTPAVSGSAAAVLNGVSCAAPTACTAVGWYVTASHISLTLAESWNGKSWASETTTNIPGASENFFNGVACAASVFCTAVGVDTTTAHLSLAEQWVGGRVTSTTSVASSANPAVTGQQTTFTATVTPSSGGSGAVSGEVTFGSPGLTLSCNGGSDVVVVSGGRAVCALAHGLPTSANHTITAQYSGTSYVVSSSASMLETVARDHTAAAAFSSTNPSVTGEPLTFTVSVSAASPGSGTPTGDAVFTLAGTPLQCNGTASDAVALSNGRASCAVAGPRAAAAPYSVAAAYSGDGNYVSSTASVGQSVELGGTATSLGSNHDPSASGQAVTFTATVLALSPAVGTPTGTVTFSVSGSAGAVTCRGGNTVTLSGGTATCTVGGLLAADAPYTVGTTYSGDSGFRTSAATPLGQSVGLGSSATSLTSSANPSASGQVVTFTATVAASAPASGRPTGTVTFTVTGAKGSIASCRGGNTATVVNGSASCVVGGLLAAAAPYTVTATYSGDSNFKPSSATPLVQTVGAGGSSTALTSNVNPAVTGQPISFTATVTANGAPTGSVTFTHGGVAFACNGTGSDVVALSAGHATCATAGQAAGSLAVLATYSGDSNFSGSSGSLTETVVQGSTATALRSSANPSSSGQVVTFTATVSAVAPAAGTPAGTVTFAVTSNAGAALTCRGGNVQPLSNGSATCVVAGMVKSGSAYTVTASYGGNTDFKASSATPLSQVVVVGTTTTTVTANANPAVTGQPVTLTATVASAGSPTGTVDFTVNGAQLGCNGTGSGVVTVSGGRASCAVGGLVPTSFTVTGTYGGDANFTGSSGSLTETVDQDAVTVVVSSNANPSVYSQTIGFTATVSAASPGAGTPTGTVTFTVNGKGECDDGTNTFTLVNGQATCPIQFNMPPGKYVVVATYSGDPDFLTGSNAGSPFTQVVNQDSTSVALNTSSAAVRAGNPVTFSSVVTANAPGSPTTDPSGTVTFEATNNATGATFQLGCNQTASGVVTLAQNANFQSEADCATFFQTAATYTITAIYSGDTGFTASSSTLTESVGPAGARPQATPTGPTSILLGYRRFALAG